MDRTAWIAAFANELQMLRPHLKPTYGSSKVAHAVALTEYDGKAEPQVAARRYNTKKPQARPR